MATEPRDPSEATWRINEQQVSLWRSWDGEIVVYDDLSGDTLKLDIIMAEVFRFLLKAPASQTQVTGHLAEVYQLEPDTRLQLLTATALQRCSLAGLIESADDGRPAALDG